MEREKGIAGYGVRHFMKFIYFGSDDFCKKKLNGTHNSVSIVTGDWVIYVLPPVEIHTCE